ncbi:hypothetical protein M409DRAFT_67450 [Zasmidium cellare ATCC 36951]|uniref:Peptidase A1 domain-containing protein n=1 Tax=Zasmidium cellare ATCC 36951 TaxID=1080233 RepID=A0A6A6CDN6_ZASCE|nr:uncharacterized protein M409DRAFT_67450 [Zasmidium cellare ATCC 36951]KAF2165181.1 hypothetical protein M409DRAFT_67450 [Zasmidium cellare ATCC 36951]
MGLHSILVVFQALASVALAALNASAPALSIPSAQVWDGDDGQWSTFQIQVGTPPQTVRVLPGTSASAGTALWVVIPVGCTSVNPTLENCEGERGELFQSNLSTTWSTQNLVNNPDGAIYSLNTVEEAGLGLSGNGSYGYDTVTFGLPGSDLPTLHDQLVVGIWTDDFFLGSLGLSPYTLNLSSFNGPQESLMGALVNQSLLPSNSWAYTAGAVYQDPPIFGSLTFGGYDTTRYNPNGLTVSFANDEFRDLLVSLKSIIYDTAGSAPLLGQEINIAINSMVSEIWLPTEVCDAFQQAFNLTFNEQGQLYFVSEEAHRSLIAQNPEFTFSLGQAGGINNGSVDIVLPYAAFDLNLTAPIVGNDTRYFPIKRSENSTTYTLGRTFLQEAYVIADYDRKNFTVAQALFPPASISQNIEKIVAPGLQESGSKSSSGLSGGAIAGIVVGVVVGVLIILAGLFLWWRRSRKARSSKPNNELGGQQVVPGRHEMEPQSKFHELDGPEIPAAELEADVPPRDQK